MKKMKLTVTLCFICLLLVSAVVFVIAAGKGVTGKDLSSIKWQKWPGPKVSTAGYEEITAPPYAVTWIQSYTKGVIAGYNSQPMKVWAKSFDMGDQIKWVIGSTQDCVCGNPAGGSWCEAKPKQQVAQATQSYSYIGSPTSGQPILLTPVRANPQPAYYGVGSSGTTSAPLLSAGYTWFNNQSCPPGPKPDCKLTPAEAAKIVKPKIGQITHGVKLH